MSQASRARLVLGDLVTAAFDRAATVTSDPRVAAELAARTTARWLTRTQRLDLLRALSAARQAPARRRSRPQPHARAA
jgi:hypothetical protein